MSAPKELCEDGKLKHLNLDTFLYPKSKQQKQSHREKQMASELSLLISWLMWAQLVYLLTYLQKSNFPYVSSSNIVYYVYYIHSTYFYLDTTQGVSGVYPLIAGSPAITKVMLTLPRARELNEWCLTPQLKKGLKEAQCYSCPSHCLGDRTEVLRSSGARKWVCNYWLYPWHHPVCNYQLYPLRYLGTATSLCSLLPVDATPMLACMMHDKNTVIWPWSNRHHLCVIESCQMNRPRKYRFLFDHLTPSLGLISLSSL